MQVNDELESNEIQQVSYCKSVYELGNFSLQIAARLACYILYMTITIHFLSHSASNTQVAGFGICLTILLLVLYPIGLGLTFSVNQQVSQALGHNNESLALQYLLLTIYSLLASYIVISLPVYFLKSQFTILISDEAEETIEAAWQLFPYLWYVNLNSWLVEFIQVYLFGNKICYHLKYVYGTTTVMHVFLCSYFIQHLQMGIEGAGIALSLTELLNLIITCIFIVTTDMKETFRYFRLRVQWELLMPYLSTSASFIFIAYIEFSFQSFMYALAARFDQHLFNAQIALINFRGLVGRLSQGLQISLQTMVGSEMSALRVTNAQTYAKSGIIVCSIFASVYIPLSIVFKSQIGEYYAKDQSTQDVIEELLFYIVLTILAHSIVSALAGVLRGMDHQEFNSKVSFIINYLIAIPLIIYLAIYRNNQLQGIWVGYTIALTIQALVFFIKIITDQWEIMSLNIYKKLKQHSLFKNDDSIK